MSEQQHTPGPWQACIGRYGKGRTPKWEIRKHEFNLPPYEGDLDDEWGIYPPMGEAGPVALVAGEENARLVAAAPDLLSACEFAIGIIGDGLENEDWAKGLVSKLTIARMKKPPRAGAA
jgi:hypothetical protein